MNTPIDDYIKEYSEADIVRMHMPGHKGVCFSGHEHVDITEIKGADSLYEPKGIIEESERNAASLFGTKRTLYSAEGSSQCVKTMLYLASMNKQKGKKALVLAGRNAHISFVQAAALLDIDVRWLWPDGNCDDICSCKIVPDKLDEELEKYKDVAAVYITSPDYLGNVSDLVGLSRVCEKNHTMLLVDNAHGAYFSFLDAKKYPEYVHPILAGATICCDSAHKTLPVLTGGAYLHLSEKCDDSLCHLAKSGMSMFGSTSPSYLILRSLDLCNRYLAENYREKLADFIKSLEQFKLELTDMGYGIQKTDPLKLTIRRGSLISGTELADFLREGGIEPEMADDNYLVLMLTPCTSEKEIEKLKAVLLAVLSKYGEAQDIKGKEIVKPEKVLELREAYLGKCERVCDKEAEGRVCARPVVSCPPAIAIYEPGEVIGKGFQGEVWCVAN